MSKRKGMHDLCSAELTGMLLTMLQDAPGLEDVAKLRKWIANLQSAVTRIERAQRREAKGAEAQKAG